MFQGGCSTWYSAEVWAKKEFGNRISVFVPDFWHHEAMLHHQRVADGRHHGENLLAGWVPPHQVEQGIGLVLTVQLVDTLLCDQLHRDSAVVLEEKDVPFRNKPLLKWSINSEDNISLWGAVLLRLTCMGDDWIPAVSSSSESLLTSVRLLLSNTGSRSRSACSPRR